MTLTGNSSQPAEQAKKFIDASLKGRSRPPSKAAYARAVKLARQAIEELAHVARRAGSPTR
jgi:hypothetical protein